MVASGYGLARRFALTPSPSPNPLRGRGEPRLVLCPQCVTLNDIAARVTSPLPRSGLGEGLGVRAKRTTSAIAMR